MNLRRTRAVARKEFIHILRDPRSLIMALALPALMLTLFGYALTLDVDRLSTLVYDSDASPESRALISRIEGSKYFQVLDRVDSYQAIEAAVDSGRCLIAVAIPRGFQRDLRQGKSADVQVIVDGSDSNTASIGLGYMESVLREYAAAVGVEAAQKQSGRRPSAPLDLRIRVWYNSELASKNYIVPGLVAVVMTIISALLTSLTIARERESGTMELILSTPLRPSELVLGKMSAYFVLGAVDTAVAILFGVVIFDVPLRGSLLLLAGSCVVFLFGALCWGILLSALAPSQLVAYQAGMITSFLPAFLLSGFVFAIPNMPVPIQIPSYLVPARYFITVLRGIFLKGVGLEVFGVELLFLVAYGGLVFLAATRRLAGKVA